MSRVATDVGIEALLERVRDRPGDLAARQRAAEALDDEERTAEALALLQPLVNFTAHEDESPLPCLCSDCAARAGGRAVAGGLGFSRAFAVAGDRVLQYWLVDDLAGDRAAMRRSVGEALKAKLSARRKGSRRSR